MINIIVPIIEKPKEFEKFVESVAQEGQKIFVGIKESLTDQFNPNAKNVKILKFSNKSKREEIINAMHSCKFSKGKILIVRRPLSKDEFDKLVESKKEIAVLKQKHNKFVSAFKKLMAKIIKKLFGFYYFEDISAVCYNESMFELLSVCSNLSLASRINRYVGINIEEIESFNKDVKKEWNARRNILKFLAYTFFWLGSITAVVLINIYTKLIVVAVMFEILLLIVSTTLWIVSLLSFSRALTVGDLHFGRAEEKR